MVRAGSGRLEKLRIKEAMTRGALPHGGGGRRFAFGGRFECSCVAAFAPAAAGASPRPPLAPWVRVCPGSAARKRFEWDTRNAARRTQRRIPPGRALRTSRQEVRRARGPSELYSESGRRPPLAPEGSVCPVGTWAEGPKRPAGVSKYKGCARPARRTPIFARCRRQSRRLSRRMAQPGGKGRRRRTFSTRALRVFKQTVNTASAA